MATPLLSEISFGSFLVYSPRGTSDVSVASRRVRDAIKRGDPAMLERVIARLAGEYESCGLNRFLGQEVLLIPAPRSAPRRGSGLWPSLEIAKRLAAAGLGRRVVTCLRRTTAVPKSAFQPGGERPDAMRHYETMSVDADFDVLGAERVTVVDDFITKGNTQLGAASRVAEVWGGTAVGAFGLVCTMGLQPDVEGIVAPRVGMIRRHGPGALRSV